MRHMGGLRKQMPITWVTMVIGTLALVGTPFFSGFYSKDAIIEAVKHANRPFADYAYWCVLLGAFVTAFYSFRLLYLTFHGKPRYRVEHGHQGHDDHHEPGVLAHEPHESPWVVTLPLVLLAIPSVIIGYLTVEPMLFGNWFGSAIHVHADNDVLGGMAGHFHGPAAFALHGFLTPVFWLVVAGFGLATFIYLFRPQLAAALRKSLAPLVRLLENKYYVDDLYQAVFARGSLLLGRGLWKGGDVAVIDDGLVNGSARLVGRVASLIRRVQTGFLYHYAFAMIVGLLVLLGVFVWYANR